MIEFLYGIDKAIFLFINQTLSNPVGDFLWPLITDYDKLWPARVILIGIWLWLMIRGGTRGRTAALMLIPLLVVSDQLSSTFIKSLVGRVRPCNTFSADQIHLLVGCGGLSFPSSHAVNNFSVATMFSHYYPKWKWAFFSWAGLVALSRPAVGVHYPSDVLGGAIIGTCVALAVIYSWTAVERRLFPVKDESVKEESHQ